MSGPFQYGLVARATTPLAEYTPVTGNFTNVAIRMLEAIDPNKPRGIVEQGEFMFLSLTDPDRMSYLCVVQKQVNVQTGYAFLEDLKSKWVQRYGRSASSFAPRSKNTEFGQTEIASLLRTFNSPSNQKISQIHANLEETQNKMTQNLTMALARGEQLSVLADKADNIRESAATFKREAEKVKCQQCVAKWKWYILGTVILLVVIFIIVWIACGASFEKCS
jgi:vesicle-associated membrane protein 7